MAARERAWAGVILEEDDDDAAAAAARGGDMISSRLYWVSR